MSKNATLQARSRLGNAVRAGDQDAATEARRDLAEAKIAQYVAKVVAEAPPLGPDQRARLAALLIGGGATK